MKIKYKEYGYVEKEIDIEFPYYIKMHDTDTMFFAVCVEEDLTFIELFKESPEYITYSIRLGDNFDFYDKHFIDQPQKENKEFFDKCLSSIKAIVDQLQ